MNQKIQSIKGFYDILPEATPLWFKLEDTARQVFRHENVQKGRQRQFHQIGVEAFGFADASVDAEQIVMLARLWQALGLSDVTLQINSIGDAEERAQYRNTLIAYFEQHADVLDEDAKRRLHTNPLRILDSKNPRMQAMCEAAPKLMDCLGEETRAHFAQVCALLSQAGVAYQINHRLVRGLDYYNRTVFEWVTDKLGAQGTIAGGGRYDTLVERLGGNPTPACGFGIGLERVFLLMQEFGITASHAPDVYLVNVGELAEKQAFGVAETLRAQGLKVVLNAGGGSFKSQMKKADKSGARYAAILGDDEALAGEISLKPLLQAGEQMRCPFSEVFKYID